MSEHVKLKWNTTAEDQVWFEFCWPRAEIWGCFRHRLTKTGQVMIRKCSRAWFISINAHRWDVNLGPTAWVHGPSQPLVEVAGGGGWWRWCENVRTVLLAHFNASQFSVECFNLSERCCWPCASLYAHNTHLLISMSSLLTHCVTKQKRSQLVS